MHGGDLADIDGDELDPGKGAAVVEIGDIRELAAQAVERFNDDHVQLMPVENR